MKIASIETYALLDGDTAIAAPISFVVGSTTFVSAKVVLIVAASITVIGSAPAAVLPFGTLRRVLAWWKS